MVDNKELSQSQVEAKDRVLANMLPDGSFILEAPNNWFLHIDPNHPEKSEIYTTAETGNPNANKKVHRGFFHEGPPYPTFLLEENDLKENGTVGGIQPLICIIDNQSYVAVQYNQRHNGVVCEAFRKGWSKPAEQPQILSEGGIVTNYTDKDLGRGLSNDARIVAKDRKLAQIEYDLTVVDGAKKLPEVDKGSWMPVEEFLATTQEHMGKGVVAIAAVMGYFPVNQEKMREQVARLPKLVEEWSK